MSTHPLTSDQSWTNLQRWISEFSATNEFKLLHELVTKDEATARDAVQHALGLASAATAARGIGRNAAGLVDYHVSVSVLELAQRLDPTKHSKLVELMSALQKHDHTDPSTGKPLEMDGSRLFQDLPSFGYTELETWCEFGGAHKDPCDLDMASEQKRRFINLNGFVAQLTQVADVENTPKGQFHPLDKSLHAIWTMQKALENKSSRPAELVNTAAMSAACMWFIYASDRLMDNVRNFRTFPEYAGADASTSREEYASQGYKGFALGRWQLWRRGLEEAREACGDEQTATLIENALAQMEKAEMQD
ncbi:hypothetical protein E8E14_010368 [Neopestalotiopsis sp. 37M]|nr:hypothetical protein E8E14_010368 [Neopestalotiopsis sp. 37M]